MTTTIEAIRGALPAGRHKVRIIPVPLGATTVTVAVDRSHFAAFTGTVQWQLWLCVDNASWAEWGVGAAPGGELRDALDGHLLAESSTLVSLLRRRGDGSIVPGYEPTNANRRVRGLVLVDGFVETALTLTFDV